MSDLRISVPEELIEDVAQAIARRALEMLEDRLAAHSPWMTTEEAIAYTRIPAGTFEKLSARGVIPSHQDGGRRKVYHRVELDEYLGYVRAAASTPTRRRLRGVDAA